MHRAPVALLAFYLFCIGWASSSGAQNDVIPDLVDRVKDGVVSISTVAPKKDGEKKDEKAEDTKTDAGGKADTSSSVGSGFIIDERGTIVTASEVIEGATEITVSLADGTKLPASVIGTDRRTGIALIRIAAATPLTVLKFGDSSKLRVGQTVVAIGNPYGLGGSVSSGIISGLNRFINTGIYDRFIQTDAVINKGNAGGPLLNLDGEVIGITMAIMTSADAPTGVAFAFPSDLATELIAQLNESGEVRRGWIGLVIQDVSDEIAASHGMSKPTGALVAELTSAGPAAKAGIEPDDVILSFDGQQVTGSRSLAVIVGGTAVGKSVDVKILRKGNERTLKLTTEQMPSSSGAQTSGAAGGSDSFDDLKDDLQKLD